MLKRARFCPRMFRDTIGSALEETERLAKIVESLLAISRLEAGEATVQPIDLDLAELARTTADHMKLLAEEKRISMTFDGTDPVEVEADPSRIKQVVVNLLDNAIKYTPEGGQVSISVTQRDSYAVLEVADSGLGISANDLPHVFERFYRADKTRSRQMGGTDWDCPSFVRYVWLTAAMSRSKARRVVVASSASSYRWPLAIGLRLATPSPDSVRS